MIKPKKAIILVAGLGTRLRPLTDNRPKCLVEINGKSILANALSCLEQNGLEETVLMVGYLKEKVMEAIGDNFGKLRIKYVEKNIYEGTSNGYSLWLAIKDINEPVLVLEGDVLFEDKLLRNFLGYEKDDASVLEKYNPELDGTFAELESGGRIRRIIHKKDREPGFTAEDKYKTVNIHKFSNRFLQQWLMPVLRQRYGDKKDAQPVETVLNEAIQNGAELYGFLTQGEKWIEIDDINDLEKAKLIF